MTPFISTSIMSAQPGTAAHPGRKMDSQTRVEIWRCGAKPCGVDVSVFVPLSVLHPVPVEDPLFQPYGLWISALQALWQPARHSEDPPLMFQRSVAQLHNIPASVATGAKALNCCLEMLSGSLKERATKMFLCRTLQLSAYLIPS